MKTRRHMSLSLEGALMNWGKSQYKNVLLDDNGKYLSPDECKRYFLQCLLEGKTKMPLVDLRECPNFDYKNGCPGHEILE